MSQIRIPTTMTKKHLSNAEKNRMSERDKLAAAKTPLPKKTPNELIDLVAQKEWKRVRKIISDLEIDYLVDQNNLIGYCNSWAMYIRATNEIVQDGFQFNIGDKTNPLITAQMKYAAEVRQFANLCGLNMDSRLKIGEKKLQKQEETLESKFGMI